MTFQHVDQACPQLINYFSLFFSSSIFLFHSTSNTTYEITMNTYVANWRIQLIELSWSLDYI